MHHTVGRADLSVPVQEPPYMSLRGRLRPWQSRVGSYKFVVVYVFNVGRLLDFGVFCLRRPHFLYRQEMGERSDSGGEALERCCYRSPSPLVASMLAPETPSPRAPLPSRWRVSLLRSSRFLISTINRNLVINRTLTGTIEIIPLATYYFCFHPHQLAQYDLPLEAPFGRSGQFQICRHRYKLE